jgi:hypothetical protein
MISDPCIYVTTHFSTLPTVKTLATLNVEIGQKNQKHRSGQIIREDVHELGGRRDVQDVDIIDDNAFLNEVDVDLKKLRMLVLNVVGGEVDDADIITIDKSAL